VPQIEDCLKTDGCEQGRCAAVGGMTKGAGAELRRARPWRTLLLERGKSSFLSHPPDLFLPEIQLATCTGEASPCPQAALPACLRGPAKAMEIWQGKQARHPR